MASFLMPSSIFKLIPWILLIIRKSLEKNCQKDLHSTIFLYSISIEYKKHSAMQIFFAASKNRAMQIRAMKNRAS